uniref:Ras-related GTP-binding protein C n=1 Tax=Heliothis virescens TaxID=7102 RepID=A0A2A4K859_HELVI
MSYQDDPSCYVGSFPKDFSYGPFEQNGDGDNTSLQEDHKPRILLMGLRRSGKSSIQKVVFHKMSPNETLFLESTNKIVKDDINNSSFVQFQIWDFPGQIDFFDATFDSDTIFGGCGALVFVIDAQDDYQDALDKLQLTVTKAYRVNSNIKFEVFIHKVDGLNDDYKMESQRDIHHRATEDLAEAGLEHVHLSFHLTSIYDHSIFEAFSKVVQKLIPQLPTLENLLNILISSYQDDPSCYVGSFPKDFSYGPFEQNGDGDNTSLQEDHKPRILLMGLRRSGKSSIQKVVFHKMSPNETLFLESTNKIVKDDINNSSFVQFQIWDFPGQIDFFDATFDSDTIFGGCGALVFVIDAQDDYQDALDKLQLTVTKAYRVNSNIKFEVFIHKVDGLNDDYKMESQRDIHHRATEDLAEAGLEHVHLSFHLTSIYDHSIFEAFSKVVQKLIPQLPTLENLLNILISNSGIEKAFLFDVVSKIYIATDSSPVDMQSYELCCDMIDVVIDISCIYGMVDETEVNTFNSQSSSLIKLNNGTVLYLREVNKFLALVCILREENFQKQGVIDYNFLCFRDAITQVFELRNKCQNVITSRATSDTPEPITNGAADSTESASDRSQTHLP